jgi:ureidoacrylate peracid hydrolase
MNEHEMVTLQAAPYPLELDLKRTAVIVVDMQNCFCKKGGMFDLGGRDISLIPATYGPIRNILEAARGRKVKVVYIVHRLTPDAREVGPFSRFRSGAARRNAPNGDGGITEGTWGTEIIPELAPAADEMIIVKRRFSAFVGTELDMMLKTFDIRYLIFTGVATNVCVESTLRDASHLEYLPVIVSDGVAASPPERQESTLGNVREIFGWVATSEAVVQAIRH